jgi:starvation-inducible DNA-binding protein
MKTVAATKTQELKGRQQAPLATPTDLTAEVIRDVAGAMNAIVAAVFALYLTAKNFHWHLSGPHFRDHHLMLDEQAAQLFAMTDPGACGRSAGRQSGRSATPRAQPLGPRRRIRQAGGHAGRAVRGQLALAARLREAHDLCNEHRDVATASLLEVWIDETERRTWFLFEASRPEMTGGH